MKSLFDRSAVDEVINRIDQLKPFASRQWGKMDAAQMLAHCSAGLDMATGKLATKRALIGRLIGPRFKQMSTDDNAFRRDQPTAKELKMGVCDFAREHERLKQTVLRFHEAGEAGCTNNPHPFFGPLTPLEWSTGMYKHLDHHLKQFGV
jgi:hypothetical protein